MPLSEHEQRLLEQMERALYAEDPKFASALRGADIKRHYKRRVIFAGVGFVIGVALLMAGLPTTLYYLSVAGFLVMFGAALYGITNWRKIASPGAVAATTAQAARAGARGSTGPGTGTRAPRPRRSFMQRIEERWERRRDQQP